MAKKIQQKKKIAKIKSLSKSLFATRTPKPPVKTARSEDEQNTEKQAGPKVS